MSLPAIAQSITYMNTFPSFRDHKQTKGSSRPVVFLRRTRSTGERPCRSAISIKPRHGYSPVNSMHISEHLFLRTPPTAASGKEINGYVSLILDRLPRISADLVRTNGDW